MTAVVDGWLSGLPERIQYLLATPPVTEKKLLELALAWPGLPPRQDQLADAVRLFVITWDPLEFLQPRPDAYATVNADPGDLEIVVYVPYWSLTEPATWAGARLTVELGAWAGSALLTAAAHQQAVASGAYPGQEAQSTAPGLLSDRTGGAGLGEPGVRLASAGWEEIGLGAITDTVQHAFGPVDLDRSLVELAPGNASPGCPACAGDRFGFPGQLAEAQAGMCPGHRREAQAVINRRLARANASNPDGWGALGDAVARLERPHLPGGLAGRLPHVDDLVDDIPAPGELARRAQHVVEATGWFAGRPHEFVQALRGGDPLLEDSLPEWLINLVPDLGRAGLGDQAVAVGEGLARLDPAQATMFHADVAVALAQAGQAEQARARVEANLRRWPDDFWITVHAGDTLEALGDRDGARAHFTAAVALADAADDFEARSDAFERLSNLDRPDHPDDAGGADQPGERRSQRRQPSRKPSRAKRKRRTRPGR